MFYSFLHLSSDTTGKKINFFLVMIIVFLAQGFYNLLEKWTFCLSDPGLKFDTHFYQEKIFSIYWRRKRSCSVLLCSLKREGNDLIWKGIMLIKILINNSSMDREVKRLFKFQYYFLALLLIYFVFD